MTYQRGDRIALVHTGDQHTRLVPGTAGTVTGYDARLGQLAVTWDDGSTLAMLLNDGDQVRPLRLRAGQAREPAQRRRQPRHEPARGPGSASRALPARHHRSCDRRQQAAGRTLFQLHPARW